MFLQGRGNVYDCNDEEIYHSNEASSKGDVIAVELDADLWTLAFRKNGERIVFQSSRQGVLWRSKIERIKIKRGKYCIAVTMCSAGDSVSFV